jgi:hypothetical protein
VTGETTTAKKLRGPKRAALLVPVSAERILEYREIAQERQNTDDDDNDPDDLLHAAIERKHIDEIEHENDDENGDEKANQRRHTVFPPLRSALRRCPHGPDARVPAEPDGTEGEDCLIQPRYSNEKTRAEAAEKTRRRSSGADGRSREAPASRRPKSAPIW